jgi:hypothetical protein
MLRKLLSLGALVVVALALGAGPAAAKRDPNPPADPNAAFGQGRAFDPDGFSDGRFNHAFGQDGFSDGRFG